jgi:hypothetical protein
LPDCVEEEEKMRAMKRLWVLVLCVCLVAVFAAVSAVAVEPNAIEVTIGDDIQTYADFDSAMAAVRAADDLATKTITLGEGTFKGTSANTFRIDEPNVVITGQGPDKTTIDTESFAVSGQAGILISADNVTVENIKVVSTNPGASGGAIKITTVGDGVNPLEDVHNTVIGNVVISTEAGYGLNIHGADNALISNVTIEKAAKACINIANATGVVMDTVTTNTSGWGTDIVFGYKADNPAYTKASTVEVSNSTFSNGMIYSERPVGETVGTDSISITGSNLVTVSNSDGSWVMATEENVIVAGSILNETSGERYTTIQAALDNASAKDVISVPAGTYQENLKVTVPVTINGEEGTIIKFDKTTREGVSYFSGTAYPVIYATADLTLNNLTVAGPTDEHHGIDGILAKAGLTMNNVTVTDIRCTADGAEICSVQYGKGVIVDGAGNVDISNCTFKAFQKCAIDISTTGTVKLDKNTITGAGDQGIIGQNGIVLRSGSKATVTGNTISDLRYTDNTEWTDCSYGIIMLGNVSADITGNTIEDVDNGVSVEEDCTANIENNIIVADHVALYADTTGAVSAPNNYWGEGNVADKVAGNTADKVTGLDDVKDEPVIDDGTEEKPPVDGGDDGDKKPDDGKDDPDTGKEDGKTKGPQTGDEGAGFWIALSMLSVAGLAAIGATVKLKKSSK